MKRACLSVLVAMIFLLLAFEVLVPTAHADCDKVQEYGKGKEAAMKYRELFRDMVWWSLEENMYSRDHDHMKQLQGLTEDLTNSQKIVIDAKARMDKAQEEVKRISPKIKEGKLKKSDLDALQSLHDGFKADAEEARAMKGEGEKRIEETKKELKKLKVEDYEGWRMKYLYNPKEYTPSMKDPDDRTMYNWYRKGQERLLKHSLGLIIFYRSDAKGMCLGEKELKKLLKIPLDRLRIDPKTGNFYDAEAENAFRDGKGAGLIAARLLQEQGRKVKEEDREQAKRILLKALVLAIEQHGTQEQHSTALNTYKGLLQKKRLTRSDITDMWDTFVKTDPMKSMWVKKGQ